MKDVIRKYFQSVISPEEFDRFCSYISQEKNTENVLKEMKAEWNKQSGNDQSVRANPLLFQKIKFTILQEENARTTRKLRRYAFAFRVAAMLTIGVLLTGIWIYMQKDFQPEETRQTVSIPYGAQTQLHLPDGSSVWLNSGSTLSYSGNFIKERRVELKGEAFFEVVKSNIPFSVSTFSGEVEVLGTSFNVQDYGESDFLVTLEQGSVKVADRARKQIVLLAPGEQARMEQSILVINKVHTELFTSWKDGKLIFSREPFPNMIKRLERWFNVDIEHPGYDFGNLWFSGTVESETLTEVMEMICKAAPVKYSHNSKSRKVTIEIKKTE